MAKGRREKAEATRTARATNLPPHSVQDSTYFWLTAQSLVLVPCVHIRVSGRVFELVQRATHLLDTVPRLRVVVTVPDDVGVTAAEKNPCRVSERTMVRERTEARHAREPA